jgi:hypothetical protein
MSREQYITSNIKTALQAIPEIKEVIPRPLGENETVEKYPCAIFYPETSENSFHSVQENIKTYRYKLHLIIGLTNDTADNVFENGFPALVDAVEDKIDEDWNVGTLSGHRVWKWIDSGVSGIDTKSNEAYRSFDINIRLLKSIS